MSKSMSRIVAELAEDEALVEQLRRFGWDAKNAVAIFSDAASVLAERAKSPTCQCPTNEAGDIRCHFCGEYVNVKCWKCGTRRGDGPCPTKEGR